MKKRNHTNNAYRNAIRDALYGAGLMMHSPAVKYDTVTGFFVESMLAANSPTETTVWAAAFSASTGKPYCAPSYVEIVDNLETMK